MTQKKRRLTFVTSAQIVEREKLLIQWLTPNVDGSKVIGGVPPTYREIARGLAKHFHVKKISERAAWSYMQEARISFPDITVATRLRGRPVVDQSAALSQAQKRPRGRPRKPPEPESSQTLHCEHGEKVAPPLQVMRAKVKGAWFAEAMQFIGLSPNTFHRLFADKGDWPKYLGKRSGFYYCLAALKGENFQPDLSADRPDDDIDHSIRLYQVTLETLGGRWCAVLFGYEPRSCYVNAACYVLQSKIDTTGLKTGLPGRPVRTVREDWPAELRKGDESVRCQLSAMTILEFAGDMRAKMAIPVDTVWLSSSLGDGSSLIAELVELEPDGRFCCLERQHMQFLRPENTSHLSPSKLCQQISSLLNAHNREVALPKLRHYRKVVDQLIETEFEILQAPSKRQTYRPKKYGARIGLSEDAQIAKDLVAYRQEVKANPYQGTSLKITPTYIRAEIMLDR